MTRAVCTIIFLNYLPYARVLCNSFLCQHPGCKFCVRLVDCLPKDVDLSYGTCELVPVEEPGIPSFQSFALC